MIQEALPSGTHPTASGEDIVKSELDKLQTHRNKVTEDNKKYLENHPELRTLLDEFVTSVLIHKPNDIIKYGLYFFTDMRKNGAVGPCPVIISGPSGVGKGTIIEKLLKTFPNTFGFSVSHTTRGPRPGEVDGIHYHFVSKPDFEEAIERGEFVEYAKVHTNYYGTSFQAIERIRTQNKVCILDIDVQGVENVKKSKLDFKSIFITPPSLSELESRLRGRGTETAEKIKIRLENAAQEMAYGQSEGNFDSIIVNDTIESTFNEVVLILQKWFPELDLYIPK